MNNPSHPFFRHDVIARCGRCRRRFVYVYRRMDKRICPCGGWIRILDVPEVAGCNRKCLTRENP